MLKACLTKLLKWSRLNPTLLSSLFFKITLVHFTFFSAAKTVRLDFGFRRGEPRAALHRRAGFFFFFGGGEGRQKGSRTRSKQFFYSSSIFIICITPLIQT